MSRQLKYKVIAAFLLLVFSINTVAGFACSIGVDMGYNRHHHEHSTLHSHSAARPHSHVNLHAENQQGIGLNMIIKGVNDDCCSGAVTKFALLDKSVVKNQLALQAPVFHLSFTSIFAFRSLKKIESTLNTQFGFVRRSCFLNDTDIRIAIQSFQI